MKNSIQKSAAVALSLLGTALWTQAQNQKPNIVFFLADDLGWTDLGCMGSDFYETPHLDKLARIVCCSPNSMRRWSKTWIPMWEECWQHWKNWA